MIFDWFKSKPRKLAESKPMWEYSEKPVYNYKVIHRHDHEKAHKETMTIINDILVKLDELKTLVDEMKENCKEKP